VPLKVDEAELRFPPDKRSGYFLERLNRFAVLVSLNGREERAHLPNSGRLRELLTPGRPVYVVPRPRASRRTGYDLLLARVGQALVSVDARLPSKIAGEALAQGAWPQFRGYAVTRPEVSYGDSRLDLLLTGGGPPCLLEVKSVTLVEAGRARFPDGPTARGRRHLHELARARRHGWRACVIFIVQRPDATAFSPNDATDPQFGRALRQVVREGVEVYAYRCRVSLEEIVAGEALPVVLEEAGDGG